MVRNALVSSCVALLILLFTSAAEAWQGCHGEQVTEVLPPDLLANQRFGSAIAADGEQLLIGAMTTTVDGVVAAGAAFLFDVPSGTVLRRVVAADPESGSRFGLSVALHGDVAVVGAQSDDAVGYDTGAVYVFSARTGEQMSKLTVSNLPSSSAFGASIDIDDRYLVVGAPGQDLLGEHSGAVYVFAADTLQQIAVLTASFGREGDLFGLSVALRDDCLLVGAPSAFADHGGVFVFDTSSWEEIGHMTADNGQPTDQFGARMAINRDLVAISAAQSDVNGLDSGAVYVFDIDSRAQIAMLLPEDGHAVGYFGLSVAIDAESIAVGMPGDVTYGFYSGAAYVFDRTSLQQKAKLIADDGAIRDYFGTSVAVMGSQVFSGADEHEHPVLGMGAVYQFEIKCSCLQLSVENLVAGERAQFKIMNGTPGARVITVYGQTAGQTYVNGFQGYCATFEIDGVTERRILGGQNRLFDLNGEVLFDLAVPVEYAGREVLFQSAQRGTCPNECVSNLIRTRIE